MSDSGRGDRPSVIEAFLIFLALFGAAYALYHIGHVSGTNAGRNQSYAATKQQNARESVRINCADLQVADFAQCAVENIKSAYDEGAAQLDLYAQQDMAKWALAMVFVAGLTAAITLWALIYIRGTLNETRQMARQATDGTLAMINANEIAQNAQRPWITVDVEFTEFEVWNDEWIKISYITRFTNMGKTIANDIKAKAGIKFTGKLFLPEAETFFEDSRVAESENPIDLMPGESVEHWGIKECDLKDLPWFNGYKSGQVYLLMLAAAYYRIPGDNQESPPRVTERTFTVAQKNTDPAKQITLRRHDIGKANPINVMTRSSVPRRTT